MSRYNPWAIFNDLIAGDPRRCGRVITHNADGTSTVEYLGGGIVRVRGQDVAVGKLAFSKDGRLDGEAPDLDVLEIEI